MSESSAGPVNRDASALLDLVHARQSLRVPFDPDRAIPKEQLDVILEGARWSPTAHNMQNFDIIVVDDPALMREITAIKRPVSETFVRENYEQLSFSEEELLERKTGILATRFPEAWRRADFRLDVFTDGELADMVRPLPPAPVVLVVVYDPSRRAPASEGDFLGIVSLGCVMENMWLAATSLGIGLHIVSSLSDGDQLKRLLGIPDELVIAFSCRLGYPLSAPPRYLRVRRDIDGFTHHNRLGG
jgi:nitroreductase